MNTLNTRVIPRNAVVWLAGLIGLAAAHYVRAQEPVVVQDPGLSVVQARDFGVMGTTKEVGIRLARLIAHRLEHA